MKWTVFWKTDPYSMANCLAILFAIKNNPYTQIVDIVGLGVGNFCQKIPEIGMAARLMTRKTQIRGNFWMSLSEIGLKIFSFPVITHES